MVNLEKVTGSRDGKHSVILFALSTCIWCRKTKALLDNLGVSYEYVYVDRLSGQDKAEVMKKVSNFNPRVSFPTVVVDDEVIVGFRKDQIERALS